MNLNNLKSILVALTVVFSFSFMNTIASERSYDNAEKIVKKVISSQLMAFKEKNVEKAYSFAAPNIKKQFFNAKNFGLMVKNGYPVIWSPKNYQFVKFSSNGTRSIQRVLFRSSTDALVTYDYLLEKFKNEWRIAGVIQVSTEGNI
jgi:transposase